MLTRVSLFPVTLKGIKASSALLPLLRLARGTPDESSTKTDSSKLNARILTQFTKLRIQYNAPHPLWIIASPLIQLPVFITAMGSVRKMSISEWPGFETGGMLWFSNLTLPALDLTQLSTPLGMYGIILPCIITVSMFANIQSAFGGSSSKAVTTPHTSSNGWVLDIVRVAMEWALVPMLIISLQLPQGTLCYWSTSSFLALTQNQLLRLSSVRSKLGLSNTHSFLAEITPSIEDSSSSSSSQSEVDARLFQQAAEYRSKNDITKAIKALVVLEDTGQAASSRNKACFVLGQLYALQKKWSHSEVYYMKAAHGDAVGSHQQARSLFGAAVAMHMQGKDEESIEAFQKCAECAASRELKARALVAQASLLEKQGSVELSRTILQKAALLEPKIEKLYLKK